MNNNKKNNRPINKQHKQPRRDFVPSGKRRSMNPGTLLAPLPAVMVTCGDMDNSDVVTVAWTGITSTKPPTLYISLRPERFSHKIITETGEFVVNLVPSSLSLACDWCGMYSGKDHDKFSECPQKLTKIGSTKVNCPSILESPLSLECKVLSTTPLGSHDMFLASVVAVTADESLFDKSDRLALENADLVAFSHGEYFVAREKTGDFGFSVRKKPKASV